MSAANLDLIIEQGATFTLTSFLKKPNKLPYDLTNFIGKSQVRKFHEDPDVIVEFTVTVPSPQTAGQVVMSLTNQETMELNFKTGVYDLFIRNIDTNNELKILTGKVTFKPQITRDVIIDLDDIDSTITSDVEIDQIIQIA